MQLALHLLGNEVALLVEHRDRLAEVAAALQAQHVGQGSVRREELAELADAAVVGEDLFDRLRARTLVAHRDGKPRHEEGGLPRALVQLVERDRPASRRKICRSGQNRTRVPVTRLATRLVLRSPEAGSNDAVAGHRRRRRRARRAGS